MNANHESKLQELGAAGRTVAMRALLLGIALWGCNSSDGPAADATADGSGTVITSWGELVAGARVYMVPADQVPTTAITAATVLSGAADSHDEPLEDLLDGALAATFPQAVTDSQGRFRITGLDPTKSYFPFVATAAATPADLLPGGSLSRAVLGASACVGLHIEVTGGPGASATFVGSSRCLQCHSDFASQKLHSHRFGLRKPGISTQLQDLSRKSTFDDGLVYFRAATSATAKTSGTALWFYDFDSSRNFDKFKIAQSDPALGTNKFKVYLWRDTANNNQFKITMENLVTLSDPDRTFDVDLTYGGGLHKQRYLLKIPASLGTRLGRYVFLQFQPEGNDSYYERTRKVWRDYNGGNFWNSTGNTFTLPSVSKTFEAECLACHATGYRAIDAATGERIADAVDDGNGDVDIDGDGTLDEINTGCEACHGAGSEHVASRTPRHIVKPQDLSPERENMLCVRCHDRPTGKDDRQNEQPLNANHQMAPPGIRRKDWLASYVTRKGPSLTDFWPDQEHSVSHHQQAADFVKSHHSRNDRRLVVCSDCHDLHGKGEYDGELKGNPQSGELCARCHIVDLPAHLLAKTGSQKAGGSTTCTSCHYYKTAKTGAGRRGILLGTPTGSSTDDTITYWTNDISSHLTTVPRRANVGVLGKVPGTAMPVPYTNRCATCHDARFLQYQNY